MLTISTALSVTLHTTLLNQAVLLTATRAGFTGVDAPDSPPLVTSSISHWPDCEGHGHEPLRRTKREADEAKKSEGNESEKPKKKKGLSWWAKLKRFFNLRRWWRKLRHRSYREKKKIANFHKRFNHQMKEGNTGVKKDVDEAKKAAANGNEEFEKAKKVGVIGCE